MRPTAGGPDDGGEVVDLPVGVVRRRPCVALTSPAPVVGVDGEVGGELPSVEVAKQVSERVTMFSRRVWLVIWSPRWGVDTLTSDGSQ